MSGFGSGDAPEVGVGRGRGRGKPGSKPRLRKPTAETQAELTGTSGSSNNAESASALNKRWSTGESVVDANTTSHAAALPAPQATPVSSLSAITIKSDLSADAPEFIPRGSSTHPSTQLQASGWSNNDSQSSSDDDHGTWMSYTGGGYRNLDPVQDVQNAVSVLSHQPASFDSVIHALNTNICQNIDSESNLTNIVEVVFDQSVTDTNFSYMGAKMCSFLSQNLIPAVQIKSPTFRQILLKRCQKEHIKRNEYAASPHHISRLHGFTFFMGELFMNMMLNNERIHLLGTACRDLILTLLDHPIDDNYKCAVRLLKFAGAALEDSEKEKNNGTAPHMDSIIQRTKQQTLEANNVSKTVKQMLLNLIELRASNWGRIESTPSPKPDLQSPFPQFKLEPTFYNVTGQVISRDEAGYHDDTSDYVPGEAEDDASVTSSDFAVNPDGTFNIGTWSNPDEEQYVDTTRSGGSEHSFDEEMQDAFEAFILESQSMPPPYP